jgi:hypothetical protein
LKKKKKGSFICLMHSSSRRSSYGSCSAPYKIREELKGMRSITISSLLSTAVCAVAGGYSSAKEKNPAKNQ